MGLKITKASDPITVERLNVVIYGPPGIGKSSLAFTADKPLLLDFDRGAYRAGNRGDIVQIEDWNDVASITADDLASYSTVIMDTAGRALDALSVDIIRKNPKHGNGGALSLQGFGQLKSRFAGFLTLLNSFGVDVVMIAHMDEQRSGDDVIERIDMQGASKNEVYKSADMMGRLVIRDRRRQLLFSPTDAAFGKNPGQLEPQDVPNMDRPEFAGFLGRLISETKNRLNSMSDAQREAVAEQDWFRNTLPTIENAEGINRLLKRAADGGRTTKALLNDRAKALGLTFDKAAKEYVAPAPKDETEEAA